MVTLPAPQDECPTMVLLGLNVTVATRETGLETMGFEGGSGSEA